MSSLRITLPYFPVLFLAHSLLEFLAFGFAMFGYPGARNDPHGLLLPPTHFRESARNAIYQQLPALFIQSSATSVKSAPTRIKNNHHSQRPRRLLTSTVFSWGKPSIRSAPSIFSSSTTTIPEDSEPDTTTIEQLINDIALHENYFREQLFARKREALGEDVQAQASLKVDEDEREEYKISLGSDLQYQNVPESLVDWNLNVTRCKLMVTGMPKVSSSADSFISGQSFPLLVGDLAQICHIILLQPHITDKEFIHTLYLSELYVEHNLDAHFKKSVAEVSVKQSHLLQISQPKKHLPSPPITPAEQSYLTFRYKEIALRNYMVNLAAAATTAYEYKIRSDAAKKRLRKQLADGEKKKLTREEKKKLWDSVRLDVFKRAGLEE